MSKEYERATAQLKPSAAISGEIRDAEQECWHSAFLNGIRQSMILPYMVGAWLAESPQLLTKWSHTSRRPAHHLEARGQPNVVAVLARKGAIALRDRSFCLPSAHKRQSGHWRLGYAEDGPWKEAVPRTAMMPYNAEAKSLSLTPKANGARVSAALFESW